MSVNYVFSTDLATFNKMHEPEQIQFVSERAIEWNFIPCMLKMNHAFEIVRRKDLFSDFIIAGQINEKYEDGEAELFMIYGGLLREDIPEDSPKLNGFRKKGWIIKEAIASRKATPLKVYDTETGEIRPSERNKMTPHQLNVDKTVVCFGIENFEKFLTRMYNLYPATTKLIVWSSWDSLDEAKWILLPLFSGDMQTIIEGKNYFPNGGNNVGNN